MKLRTAIKIMRCIENPITARGKLSAGSRRWRRRTVLEARRICRCKWLDKRIPYMPTDAELLERFGLGMSVLADCLIDDPAKCDQFKTELWTMLDAEL